MAGASTFVIGVLRVRRVVAVSFAMSVFIVMTGRARHVEVVQQGVPPIGESEFSTLMTCGVALGCRAQGSFSRSIFGGQR